MAHLPLNSRPNDLTDELECNRTSNCSHSAMHAEGLVPAAGLLTDDCQHSVVAS
jgi:hypothetical protein